MCNPETDRKPAGRLGISRLLWLGFLISFLLPAANATALHWQLNGVTFSDGGRAFGGFDFDAATGVYTNINITTTPGGAVAQGSFYNTVAPYAAATSIYSLNAVSSNPVFSGTTLGFALAFAPGLTAAGGTVTIATSAAESICGTTTCNSGASQRTVTGGTASAISTSSAKRWYFEGVVLSDGAEIFGSFLYDASTGTYSSISVTTTGGKSSSGAGYFTTNSNSATSLNLISSSGVVAGSTTMVSVTFGAALTNAGGSMAIASGAEVTCTSANCSTSNSLRTLLSGFVSTIPADGEIAILPQIADGGGFVTELIITNPSGAPITCRVSFWQDNGNILSLSLNGAAISSSYVVVVPGHSTQFLSTPGTGPSVTGWALAEHVSHLGVIAAFRLQVPNVPESEATVRAIPATAGFAMAFDESSGFDTGFALANVSAYDTVIENLYFYDTNGALFYSDSSHNLGPHQHESFLFSGRYPSQLRGKRGTVRVYYGVQGTPTYGTVGLTGLGLRVNPGSTFTSLPTTTIE